LDEKKRALLDSIESGEWVSVPNVVSSSLYCSIFFKKNSLAFSGTKTVA
jgi:hypothetical protein